MYLTVPPFPMNIMGSCWISDWPHSKNLFLQLLTSLSNLLPECSFSQRWCCLHIATGKLILKCQQPQWACRIISSEIFLIYEMLEPNGIIIFFERREIERFESVSEAHLTHGSESLSIPDINFHTLWAQSLFLIDWNRSLLHAGIHEAWNSCRVIILTSSPLYFAAHSPDLLTLQSMTSTCCLTSPAFPDASQERVNGVPMDVFLSNSLIQAKTMQWSTDNHGFKGRITLLCTNS